MLVNLNPNYSNPQFQRKPNAVEMKKYTATVSQGLKVLDKNLGLIVHNSSVPSLPKQNLGIGSLLSKAAQVSFLPFLAALGFTTVQQEPDGIRSGYVASPYSPISSSKNIFMIPIERLATEEYANLVSEEEIQNVVNENSLSETPNTVNYQEVLANYDKVLSNAYHILTEEVDEAMLLGLSKEDRLKHIQLKEEFEDFKRENYEELEPNAIYEILAKKNNNENWRTWSKEEQTLYTKPNNENLEKIRKRKAKEIDYHMFKQWLVERETENANLRNEEIGVRVIGDSPVAWTPVEEWMNQDLFMKKWALGCPPDYFSKSGQRWNFAVLKPETIFNEDGSLGKGGELMKKRYEKMFKASPGGARIDHIIGLIDPFVYQPAKKTMRGNNAGRLYSTPEHPVLGQYAKKRMKEYSAILEKIVFPAAEKYGLSKEDIICEDLGTVTKPVKNVMRRLGLSGISVTQFDYRGKKAPERNIIMPGSHDNESFIEYTDMVFDDKKRLRSKSIKLANDTTIPNEDKKSYRKGIATDKTNFISASFAELFTSPAKKVQMFFTSFFGMPETYNRPGTTAGCWTLRLPENFENLYWDNVKNGTALNLPEAIARAIRNKGEDFAEGNKELLTDLDEFTQILKS